MADRPTEDEPAAFEVVASCSPLLGDDCGWAGRLGRQQLFRTANADAPDDHHLYPTFACPDCGLWSLAWVDAADEAVEKSLPVRDFRGDPARRADMVDCRAGLKGEAEAMREALAQHYEAAGFADYRTLELAGRTDAEVRQMHAVMVQEDDWQ